MSYLSHLTFVQKLYEIAPGYRLDKDEDWICHLSVKEQRQIREGRATFIEDVEGLKEYIYDYNYKISQMPDRASKKRKEEELKPKRREIEAKLQSDAKQLISNLSDLKKKAMEINRKKLLKTHEKFTNMARENARNVQSEKDSDSEDEDDYLPSKRKRVDQPQERRVPTPVPEANNKPPTPPPVKTAEEKLVEGLDPRDAEIVIYLKEGIMRFSCLDRVANALLAYREGEKLVNAIENLDKALSKHRNSKKT